MVECEKYRMLLWDYAGGALDSDARASLEKHLASCASCSSELNEIREILKALEELNEDPPKELHASIMEAVNKQKDVKKKTNKNTFFLFRRPYATIIAAAVLVIAITGGAFWSFVLKGAGSANQFASVSRDAVSAEMAENDIDTSDDAAQNDSGSADDGEIKEFGMSLNEDKQQEESLETDTTDQQSLGGIAIPDIEFDDTYHFIIVSSSSYVPESLTDYVSSGKDGYLIYTVPSDMEGAITEDFDDLNSVYAVYEDGNDAISAESEHGLVIIEDN